MVPNLVLWNVAPVNVIVGLELVSIVGEEILAKLSM